MAEHPTADPIAMGAGKGADEAMAATEPVRRPGSPLSSLSDTPAPRAAVPARLDGDMLVSLLRLFPNCELEITGVIFTLKGTEFRTQTMEGAVALIRELVKKGAV